MQSADKDASLDIRAPSYFAIFKTQKGAPSAAAPVSAMLARTGVHLGQEMYLKTGMNLKKFALLRVKQKPPFACLMLESAQEAMQSELGTSNEDGIVCIFDIGERGMGGDGVKI